MSNRANQSQSKKLYLKSERKPVEVPAELHKELQRDANRMRKYRQYHEQCNCPRSKFWLCDGECVGCEFFLGDETLSLDFEYKSNEGETYTLYDVTPNCEPDIPDMLADMELLAELYSSLEELEPMARLICEMFMDGRSEREMAEALGFNNQSSVNHLKSKTFKFLHQKLSKFIL